MYHTVTATFCHKFTKGLGPMRITCLIAVLIAIGCASSAMRADDNLPDIGTRKAGVDWPRFLGPTGDGKSPEKGLLTKWPAEGPRIVWKMRLGSSYGAPVVAKGRLFMFDRFADKARLTCCKSETGDELWRFE